MIGSGVFDRHPKLQVVVVHIGGDLTSIFGRLDFCWKLNYHGVENPSADKVAKNVRTPSDYFRTNILVDSFGFNPFALRAAICAASIESSSVPTSARCPTACKSIDMVTQVVLNEEDQEKVYWRNSDALFGLALKSLALSPA